MSDDLVRVITTTGTTGYQAVTVKQSGWIVCRSTDGETFHYPPHRIKQIKGPLSRRADVGVKHENPHGDF